MQGPTETLPAMNSVPLKGITVLELGGLAPIQFCGKILSDFGARVIRVDKVVPLNPYERLLGNNKLSVALNFKSPDGLEVFKKLSSKSDVLIEPYRTGVMEKLGLGPDVLLKENKRLIYARLTGYGQNGAYSKFAGHDMNFASLSGVLSLLGWRNKSPDPPCNIIGDFAGGSVLCALGIVMALLEREKSGLGQVVDCSMMRGAAYITSWIFGAKNMLWTEPRGHNLLDGGAYFYDVYETKDGKWMAVASIEEKFYDNLLLGLNLTNEECPYFYPKGREILTQKFKEKTQAEWTKIFSNHDACVSPVLSVEEAATERPHDFVKTHLDETIVPKPEPLFSRSKPVISALHASPDQGQHTVSILQEIGYSSEEIHNLAMKKAIFPPKTSKL